MNNSNFKKSFVCIDNDQSLPCYLNDHRWNGWRMPAFSREQLPMILNYLDAVSFKNNIVSLPEYNFDESKPESEDNPKTQRYEMSKIKYEGEMIEVWFLGDGFVWDEVTHEDKDKTLSDAIESFWEVICHANPQINSGDVMPLNNGVFESHCKKIFDHWLENNLPRPSEFDFINMFNISHSSENMQVAIDGARCCLDECGFENTDEMTDDEIKNLYLSGIKDCEYCEGLGRDLIDERRPCSHCNQYGKVKL